MPDVGTTAQPVPVPSHRAIELLERLGATADEVAASLEGLNCRGERMQSRACPVAVYLIRSDLGLSAVTVGDEEISDINLEFDDDVEQIQATDAVHIFIERFDQGLYPQLVVGEQA